MVRHKRPIDARALFSGFSSRQKHEDR